MKKARERDSRARLEEEIRRPIRPQVIRPHGFAVPDDPEAIKHENALMEELHQKAITEARRTKLRLYVSITRSLKTIIGVLRLHLLWSMSRDPGANSSSYASITRWLKTITRVLPSISSRHGADFGGCEPRRHTRREMTLTDGCAAASILLFLRAALKHQGVLLRRVFSLRPGLLLAIEGAFRDTNQWRDQFVHQFQ
jgi:hypothetical protein